jgi:Ala-tRNA(Pro) deacylase
MSATKLKQFLDSHQIKYVTVIHSPAYTAREIAAAVHIPGKEMAKAVMVRADGKLLMTVLPSTHALSLALLGEVNAAHKLELAEEASFADIFSDCEVGAMPPFGNLYDLEVYAADLLSANEYITFNAGTHAQVIRLRYEDYLALVKPRVVKLTV